VGIRKALLLGTGFSCKPSQGIPLPSEPVVSGCCGWQDSRPKGPLLSASSPAPHSVKQQVKPTVNFLWGLSELH